jgi:hypothetical protein
VLNAQSTRNDHEPRAFELELEVGQALAAEKVRDSERNVRLAFWLLTSCLALGACTPEAVEVDGVAGNSAGGAAGATVAGASGASGAAASVGGMGGMGSPDCAPVSAPRSECTECVQTECADELAACAGNECTCGMWGGVKGQISCMLACPGLTPMMSSANSCAAACGFDSLGGADPRTHALFDCLVNPPSGPPACPACFSG